MQTVLNATVHPFHSPNLGTETTFPSTFIIHILPWPFACRYLFHEIRVPLQGGQLALQELQVALESGELMAVTPQPHAGAVMASHPQVFLEMAQTATGAIGVVGKLLDDFLSIAKIEEGRMELEPVDMNVGLWLQATTAVFMNALRAKRLRLHVSIAPDVPHFMLADGNRLRQV
jgi:signal transduction histidine kinase